MRINETIINELRDLGDLKICESLCGYTTFKTGGPADYLVTPSSIKAVSAIVKITESEDIPLTIIGGGSNLLVSDEGIEGIVLRLAGDSTDLNNLNLEEDEFHAGAGISKEDFINYAVESGYGGVEFMAGIPGSIGGGIFMNAGTNLGCFADILKSVNIIDSTGNEKVLKITGEVSAYRKMNIGRGSVITGGSFLLPGVSDPQEVRNCINEILSERKGKHPLDYPSAGSVFMNPDGHSSWKLIDDAGLKGKRIGGAAVSELHTNFIINAHEATSRDIRSLIEYIQDQVMKKFGIHLETEIRMMGRF